jgi:ascorbate-specific PTS system EIIC-type component UlaA
MSKILYFISENYVSIAIIVSFIFTLLIIISIREWDLNPPKPQSKLVQQVVIEAFKI